MNRQQLHHAVYNSPARVISCAIHATAAPLTVERIFGAPDLSGPRLREPKFSPDGRYVTYLQGKAGQQGPAGPVGLRHAQRRSRGCWSTRARWSAAKSSCRPKKKRGASGSARPRCAESSSTSSPPTGERLLIPLGGDLYLYELNARANPVTRLTADRQRTRPTRASRPAGATSASFATRTCS